MNTNVNIVRIKTSLSTRYFEYWLGFLYPLHHLTKQEVLVASELIKQRYFLSKVIDDNSIIDSMLFSEKIKGEIIKSCNMTKASFNMALVKLRKKKVISNGKLNSKLIPTLSENPEGFTLTIYFDLT